MTPDERWALIHRPFIIRTHGATARWAGCIVGDSFPKGREGEALLHDRDVDPFPMVRNHYIHESGKRYVFDETVHWPTDGIDGNLYTRDRIRTKHRFFYRAHKRGKTT